MRALLAPLTAVIVGLAAGCATVEPAPPELPFEPPEHWPQEDLGDFESASGPWWHRFNDPQLSALIAEALAANPTLDAAAARLEAALAQARIAGADRLPQADVSFDGARRRQNFVGFPIPGAEDQVLSTTATTVGIDLGIAWQADLWGRLRASRGAALVRGAVAEADLAALQLSLAGQVAKSWFGWLEARQQLMLAADTLDNRQQTREQIERRYQRGLRSALDLRRALASEADAQAQQAERRLLADAAARRMQVLLLRYPDAALDEPTPPLPSPPPPVPLAQPAELVTRRPDLVAAEFRLAASGLDVAAAKAALYPTLRLSGTIGRSSTDLEDLIDSNFSIWSLAAGLVQPLFQGGRLRAAVSLTEARQQEAAANYLEAAITAFGDVEAAFAAERWLAERVAALELSREQSLAARDLAEERYRSGLTEYLPVLDAKRQATLAGSQLLTARRRQLEARVDLHLALGGDHSEANNETHKVQES